jgi:4-hydroxybenzoate polyprenyltransferase
MPAKAFRDGDSQLHDEQSDPKQNRDVFRGVWELARLHTYESLITVFPALWGACVAAGTRDITLNVYSLALVLFGILASGVASHCAFTTLK